MTLAVKVALNPNTTNIHQLPWQMPHQRFQRFDSQGGRLEYSIIDGRFLIQSY